MAPRTIRRRALAHTRVEGIPHPMSEGVNRKVYLKLAQMHRRIIGPRAYTMNVVERFLLPRPEGMGIPPRRTHSANVLQGYLEMMRRINRKLCPAQALHPNVHPCSPPPQRHHPRAEIVASNDDPAAQLQGSVERPPHPAPVDIYLDSSAMVAPSVFVHREEDDAEELVAHDDAITLPEHGYGSPLLSPIVSSDEGYGNAIMSPEIEHSYYDCPLCLSMQASPTDSNVDLDEVQDYEPNLFR